jgi:hypothetical protein
LLHTWKEKSEPSSTEWLLEAGVSIREADGSRSARCCGRVLQETTIPNAQPTSYASITIAGDPAPVRAHSAREVVATRTDEHRGVRD